VEAWRKTLDEEDPDRLASEHALASAYLSNRQMDKAIILLEHAVAVKQEILADDNPGRWISRDLLQRAYNMLLDTVP
jgi:hypothetical protein